jgi:hypothetical protein
MKVPEVQWFKSLKEENTSLKKRLAKAMLDKESLQVKRILGSIALFRGDWSGLGIYLPCARSKGL